MYSTRNVYVIVSLVSIDDAIILRNVINLLLLLQPDERSSANDFVNRRRYAFMFLRRRRL